MDVSLDRTGVILVPAPANDSITDARLSAKLLRLEDGFEVVALPFFAELKNEKEN